MPKIMSSLPSGHAAAPHAMQERSDTVSPVKALGIASMRIVDSLFVTIVFSAFGLANADNGVALALFIAAGAALDALKNSRRLQMPVGKVPRFGGWFVGIQLAFTVAAIIAFALSRSELSEPPGAIHTAAAAMYDLNAPWIRLLRTQYQELISHGYDLRAAQIAIYYPILFALFYLALAFQTVQFHRCFRPERAALDPIQRVSAALRQRPILILFTAAVLSAGFAVTFYKITAAGIEWNEQGGKWRWDLDRSDGVLFNYLALMPCMCSAVLAIQYCIRRGSSAAHD